MKSMAAVLRFSCLPFVMMAICGCSTVGDCITKPVAMGTQVGDVPCLVEPGNAHVSVAQIQAISGETYSIPVSLEFPDARAECMVTRLDWLGDAKSDAKFASGSIVERVFHKIAWSLFHVAAQNEQPAAIFRVRIQRNTAREALGDIKATVDLKIEIARPESEAVCFSEAFEATTTAPWTDRKAVPEAFYHALESVIADFAAKWRGCGAVATLRKWRGEMAAETVPPSLKAIEWTHSGDAWIGTCEVLCNGYEGFEAKAWANAQIAAACRMKLGGIEPERVRIVYDGEGDDDRYDPDAKEWRFRFYTFARTRVALSFDKTTRHGVVIGDLELMKMNVEQASEELKRFAQDEMDSRAGKVSRDAPKGKADLRFDEFVHDKTYNLVTHTFRLL